MLILGIETATQQVGVAVGGHEGVLASFHAARNRRHAETLAPGIEFICKQARIDLSEISVVAVGTADAPIAFATDAQMRSRFTPFEIPRWRENEELRSLLSAFERVLPLRKPSDLSQRPIVQFVLSSSAGLTGEISRLLNGAAALAIHDGTEMITLKHLEFVAGDDR